jgi:hypothetical protein
MSKIKAFYGKIGNDLGLDGDITHPEVKKAAGQIIKTPMPTGMGLVSCDHCGLDFDSAETKDINPHSQPFCADCLDIYFANYDPCVDREF